MRAIILIAEQFLHLQIKTGILKYILAQTTQSAYLINTIKLTIFINVKLNYIILNANYIMFKPKIVNQNFFHKLERIACPIKFISM